MKQGFGLVWLGIFETYLASTVITSCMVHIYLYLSHILTDSSGLVGNGIL